MAILQVRDMDDRLYDRLKFAAKRDNRSISQQVITILQDYFTSAPVKTKNATEEFLKLAGSWEDFRSTEEIIDDNTPKLEDMPEEVKAAEAEHQRSLNLKPSVSNFSGEGE